MYIKITFYTRDKNGIPTGSTVISLAGIFERQWLWTSWFWPWVYRSNAQVRIEWFLLEVHHIRPAGTPSRLDRFMYKLFPPAEFVELENSIFQEN